MTKKADNIGKAWLPQVWWVPIVVVFLTVLGAVILERIKQDPPTQFPPSTPPVDKRLLEKISFDYWGCPDAHGWDILDQPQPVCKHISQGFVGEALEISSYEDKAMDYQVSLATGFGTMIEYVIKPDRKTTVYAKIKALSGNNSASKDIWLAFVSGAEQPKRIYDGEEWTVYVVPEQLGGGWLKYQVDLKDVAQKTINTDGWNLEKILAFRLRGNLSIASITIHE